MDKADIETMIIGSERSADNLPMYFTNVPDNLTLVVEHNVCEIPWHTDWAAQMATIEEHQFHSYYRLNIKECLHHDMQIRIERRLREVLIAFKVYQRAITENNIN